MEQARYENVFDRDGVEIVETSSLNHPENYGPYVGIANGEQRIAVDVSSITKDTWQTHYDSILNLFKDGIETDEVQKAFLHVTFTDGMKLDLSVEDYLLNLIMWSMLIRTDVPICGYHVFFDHEIKQDSIKDYIDRFLIDVSRKRFTNKELNNIIDDTLCHIHDIDEFAMFLANTVNLEDNVFLMRASKEFDECMHADLSGTPIEDVKNVGMQYANRAIDIMKHSKQLLGYDHCLADAWRASEGINPKQFKEFTINIGTKPDGQGGIFPTIVNKSFINGGVASPVDYFIDSSTGRTAQIIKYDNVGDSGAFARILGLNNMDSFLNEDPDFDCCSQNFLEIVVRNDKTLKMLMGRYYRLHPHGVEYCINPRRDKHLIGKKIYLRSPITCASAARGHGVCYKCYGDLAYTVYDAGIHFGVNIGRIASETMSSSLTQKLLSAKHLLETFIEKIAWVREFNELFETEGNVIRLNADINFKDYKLVIDPDAIELENEEDDDLANLANDSEDEDSGGPVIYNEYICEFDVVQVSTGNTIHICNEQNAKLYISTELNQIIRRRAEPVGGKIVIDFADIKDCGTIFVVPIQNNELSKTLNHLESLLNKNSTIKGMNLNQLLQALIDTAIEGGIKIASTHLEVILSNQVRDADDILEKAKWYEYAPRYEILSLDKALTCNPSITVSLSYQKVARALYNPLTYRKHGASFMDLFFMENPQYAIAGLPTPGEDEFKPTPGVLFDPIIPIGNPDKVTMAPSSDRDEDEDSE